MNATQLTVLRMLADQPGVDVSGERMSTALGISRSAVAKAIGTLREMGYDIDSSPARGHRLLGRPDLLLPFEVLDGLRARSFGRVVEHHLRIASTQTRARALAELGEPDGTLVVAEEQTVGRGRVDRAYFCPPGGIWFTLIVRGPLGLAHAPLVSLATGVAMGRAVTETSGLPAVLKWPNDLLVDGLKVCGILTELVAEEQTMRYMLVGVGLNANIAGEAFSDELRAIATSLSAEAGRPIDRRVLLQRFLTELEAFVDQLRANDFAAIVEAWRAHPNFLGEPVRVSRAEGAPFLEGRALRLNDDGSLALRTLAGDVVDVTAGDVMMAPQLGD